METATAWLLEKLRQEGRQDLLEGYLDHNRAYQRDIAIKARKRQIAKHRETLARGISSPAFRERVEKQLAGQEKALARMLEEENEVEG